MITHLVGRSRHLPWVLSFHSVASSKEKSLASAFRYNGVVLPNYCLSNSGTLQKKRWYNLKLLYQPNSKVYHVNEKTLFPSRYYSSYKQAYMTELEQDFREQKWKFKLSNLPKKYFRCPEWKLFWGKGSYKEFISQLLLRLLPLCPLLHNLQLCNGAATQVAVTVQTTVKKNNKTFH